MYLGHMILQQSSLFISLSTNLAIDNILFGVDISNVALQLLNREETIRTLLPHVDMNIFVMSQSVTSLVEASVTNRAMELAAIFVHDGRDHWALHLVHGVIARVLINF